MAVTKRKLEEIDLNVLLETFNKRFDRFECRLNTLEKQSKDNVMFQEKQVQHYKIRLQNQEDIKDSLKTITNALVETPLNDGGIVKKVKENSLSLHEHSIVLGKHKDFFIILGVAVVTLIGAIASILSNK